MGSRNSLIVGTRRSELARAQTELVISELARAYPGVYFRVEEIVTDGDRRSKASLVEIGGEGVFTKEIEKALLARRIDLAVHSLKDLPTRLPENLLIAAVFRRDDPRDALICRAAAGLSSLPPNATIGTSSPRRRAQLLAARPDLAIRDIRGNVETRLRKLADGEYDAIILAVAGLLRLGLTHKVTEILPLDVMLPAVGQGALAIETRADDDLAKDVASVVDHPESRACVEAERALLRALGGGCRAPFGAIATAEPDGSLLLRAVLASPDGRSILRREMRGDPDSPRALGESMAKEILEVGGGELLRG